MMTSTLRILIKTSVKEGILANSSILLHSPNIQSVRFRKPRWVPLAKSKEFYVRKPTPIVKEEYDELKIRYRLYRSEVESIRKFLTERFSQTEVNLAQERIVDNAADLKTMKEQVKEWNRNVASLRGERQAQENMKQEQDLYLQIKKEAEDRLSTANEANKTLHKHKTMSADFIGAEKLEEEIEKLLDSRSDYNFAITKTGDILPGEYPTRPQDQSQHTKKTV